MSGPPANISVSPTADTVAVSDSGATRFYGIDAGAFPLISTHQVSGSQNPRIGGWSPNGSRFWRTDGGGAVKILRRVGDIFELEFSINTGAWIYGIAFVEDDLILVAKSDLPTLVMYRLNPDGTYIEVWSATPDRWANLFCVSHDGAYLVVPDTSARLRVWKKSGDEFVYLTTVNPPVGTYPTVGIFSGDGKTLIIGAEGGWITQYTRQGDVFSAVAWSQDKPSYNDDNIAFNQDDSLFCIPFTVSGAHVIRLFGRRENHYEADAWVSCPADLSSAVCFSPPRGYAVGFKPISGHVFDADGNPVSRIVRAYHRDTGNLVGEAVSDPLTGEYGFNAFKWVPHYVVVLDDGAKNAMILDHITPIDLP